jgi:hypothetical protein
MPGWGTGIALALLALSVWLAPKVARWLLTLHDRENCRVCRQRAGLD